MRRERRAKVGEFFRELGVLWVAFAPLDSALSPERARWEWLILFILAGLFALSMGLLIDRD